MSPNYYTDRAEARWKVAHADWRRTRRMLAFYLTCGVIYHVVAMAFACEQIRATHAGWTACCCWAATLVAVCCAWSAYRRANRIKELCATYKRMVDNQCVHLYEDDPYD